MQRVRHCVATSLLAAWSYSGLAAAAPASEFSTPAPIVRPGFYMPQGGASCRATFGPAVFLPHRAGTLIMAGGIARAVLLRRESETRYAIRGSDCTLDFTNNDLRTLGICSRILSHRGDSRTFPANTMPAFQDAMIQGFSGFELDVRMSSDRVAIVSHDDNLAIATDCRGRIAGKGAPAIAQCRALRSPLLPESRLLASPARLAAPVPTLGQALERFLPDPRVQQIVVDIKVKGGREELVDALARAVSGCPGPDCATIQRRLTFITQDQEDSRLLRLEFPLAYVALESNDTVSGLIDEPDGDHWRNPHIDTYSLSFNSLFDFKLKIVKLFRRENLTPIRRFRRFYDLNRGLTPPRRLLGWTINSRDGVRGLRDYIFADVLTDLSYAAFVRQLMGTVPAAEMERNLGRIARGEGIGCEQAVAGTPRDRITPDA